ncbi:hypothetical protein AVEN_123319-1 [Araneus ventricosus]|uniref:Uncharacterized protein n=1 Tax=Araneus ventricosus TaxID=182803 RepID=A0A4Y2KPT8_ARAVE|nr:hypothetical protein AVEN_123319-1 [Araneus ventricosus]
MVSVGSAMVWASSGCVLEGQGMNALLTLQMLLLPGRISKEENDFVRRDTSLIVNLPPSAFSQSSHVCSRNVSIAHVECLLRIQSLSKEKPNF